MKKNGIISVTLAAAMALPLAGCGSKQPNIRIAAESATIGDVALRPDGVAGRLYENGGLTLLVPLEYDDLLNVAVENGDNDVLFSVAEKASVEAAKKQGSRDDGAGELFSILRVTADELNARRCYDMSGQEAFAKDADGNCYLFCHPTDVRYVRDSYEGVGDESNEDWKQWSALNEWGWGQVRETFLAENPGLTPCAYGNSVPEMFLARAAYEPGTKYTMSTLEAGTVEPAGRMDAAPYVERLTVGAAFEMADESETPDGEYAVIYFVDDDYRFDFFLAPGGENYIRQTWNNGQNVELYKVTYADGAAKAGDVVKEWYGQALAAVKGT